MQPCQSINCPGNLRTCGGNCQAALQQSSNDSEQLSCVNHIHACQTGQQAQQQSELRERIAVLELPIEQRTDRAQKLLRQTVVVRIQQS